MIRILTLANTCILILIVGGATFAYFQRGKITESVITEVKKQLPSLIKGAVPKISVPSSTGNVLPFNR